MIFKGRGCNNPFDAIYTLNGISCLFVVILIFIIPSCSDKKGKEWILTENGYYFWGLKSTDDAIYQWDGDSIYNLAHGKGNLKVIQDNGTYTNTASIKLNYGAINKSDWKHTANGVFLGEMKENRPTGFGVLKMEDNTYIGIFKDGVLDGGEVTILINDTLLYHGAYSKGQYHGDGVLYDKHNKTQYIGEFKNGLYHGFGKLLSDGDLVYIGNWKNGQYHGEGILYKDGNAIKGDWSKGLFQKPLVDRTIEQIADQWNSLRGKDITDRKSPIETLKVMEAEAFVIDSLTAFVSRIAREKIQNNVEDRFGITSIPRILWQKIFSDNVDRMDYAQEAFLKEISPEEMKGMINEKIRFHNENSSGSKIKSVEFSAIDRHEIVTESVFRLIQTRETMEYTDLFLGIIIDLIIGLILGYIIGFLVTLFHLGGVGRWPGAIIGAIIGIIVAIVTIGKAEAKLEEDITQQVIENFMNYINKQDIINQTLY